MQSKINQNILKLQKAPGYERSINKIDGMIAGKIKKSGMTGL